ncbi:hypothetical protein [uncultured Paludibaculum sp.]|uniref:hypothetical protein n=1 Tax=uncultured Paludibaculum sp. TaxID=1765020 RepID=UPI002AAC39E5|nr:hypothetical protein [uncultured Paludibaculum sp.]
MTRFSFHSKGLLPAVALSCALLSMAQGLLAQAAEAVLPDGTPVRLRLSRNLSSAEAKEGETVDFEVLEDVSVSGNVVIQKGSVALATVTMAVAKRNMGRGGKLDVNIDHVRLVNGEKAALRSVKQAHGGGNTGKMTGAVVATSIVFFPAAPLFLFVKGKDVTIPKGTEITAYVNGDFRLSAPATLMAKAAPVAAPSPVLGQALTNGNVLELKKAGLSDDLIVAKIRASRGDYRLETDDLIALKKAGLSDAAIRAMLEAAR